MEQDEEQEKDVQSGRDDEREGVYSYGDSGIEERHGHVPLWLWVVVAALMVWGVYYLAAYWSPPA